MGPWPNNASLVFPGTRSHVLVNSLTPKFTLQTVTKLIFTKPEPQHSMPQNFRNYVQFRKMHKFRTTLTQAKTRCDNSKTTLNMII